ncbi:hypothetical protein Acy02nite_55330 [Actinoplanes cyaneus]|uniref:Uncharacterized protein n=1 Tax=Actinoplanes cyaneus TaxID=52696 RepID=A0A919INM9_9ACTN|nr:hypothetical protein [Actinoplanes cyaneus]MCW2140048.1 hypothetical protein [Actinoplanes cyaneus]GID67652.1 hypothetical protein Acy02nite_55330 [Actinoplanes cyaneus]
MTALDDLGRRVSRWWGRASEHLVYHFAAAPGTTAPIVRDSYVRVWLTDMFLADARVRAADVFPALRCSVTMDLDGTRVTTSAVVQAPPGQEAPGPRSGSLTGWVPYTGGSVGIQACLYAVKANDSLRLALDVLGVFASVAAPTIPALAQLGEQVAKGIDKVESAIDEVGDGPRLVLDKEYALTGGTSDRLTPGHLAVINRPARDFDVSRLDLAGGQLRLDGGPLDGTDYLVLELQTTRERDDWTFPELDELVREAKEAQLRNETGRFDRLRQDLLVAIFTHPGLTHADQKRVAAGMRRELEDAGWGAAARDEVGSVADLVRFRGLPAPSEVGGLTLGDLLG